MSQDPSTGFTPAEVVFFNGKIATQDDKRSFADSLAVANGRVIAAGSRDAVMRHVNDATRHVDLKAARSFRVSTIRICTSFAAV